MIISSRTTRLAFVLILLQLRSTAASLNIDLVIVVHGDLQWYEASMKPVKDTLAQELPKRFQIGDDQTRLAFIRNTDPTAASASANPSATENCPEDTKDTLGQWNVLDLTGKFADFNSALGAMARMCPNRNLAGAFELVRKTFAGPATRPRVVLVLSIFEEARAVSDQAQEIAEQLRQQNVVIFVFYEVQNQESNRTAEFAKLASTPALAYKIQERFQQGSDKFDAERFEKFVNSTTNYVCRYETNCFYADDTRQKCEKSSYQPSFSDLMEKRGSCSASSQSTAAPTSCKNEDCDKVCEEMWPWQKACGCGVIGRKGEARWKQLEFCTPSLRCSTTCDPNDPGGPGVSAGTDESVTDEETVPKGKKTTQQPSNVGTIVGSIFGVIAFIGVVGAAVAFVVIWKKKAAIPKKGKKGAKGKKGIGKKKSLVLGKKSVGIAGKKGKKKAESDIEAGSEPESGISDKSSKKDEAEDEPKATGKKLKKPQKAESEISELISETAAPSKVEPEPAKSKSKSKAKGKGKVACKIPAKKGKSPKKRK